MNAKKNWREPGSRDDDIHPTTTGSLLQGDMVVSPTEINTALRSLQGVQAEIPPHEMQELQELLSLEISDKISEVTYIFEQLSGENPVLVAQMPRIVTIDNQEAPFSLSTLGRIIRSARNSMVQLDFDRFVPRELLDQPGDGHPRCYTFGLIGSGKMSYQRQLAYQKAVLGDESQIGLDAAMVAALGIMTGRKLDVQTRLNNRATDNDPLCVKVNPSRGISVFSSFKSAYEPRLIGASCIV